MVLVQPEGNIFLNLIICLLKLVCEGEPELKQLFAPPVLIDCL